MFILYFEGSELSLCLLPHAGVEVVLPISSVNSFMPAARVTARDTRFKSRSVSRICCLIDRWPWAPSLAGAVLAIANVGVLTNSAVVCFARVFGKFSCQVSLRSALPETHVSSKWFAAGNNTIGREGMHKHGCT